MPILFFAVISLVITNSYITHQGRPFYVDSVIPLSYSDIISRYIYTWNPNLEFNNVIYIQKIPSIVPLATVFRLLDISEDTFVKFIFWLPLFLSMTLAFVSLKLLNDHHQNKSLNVLVYSVISMYYGLNPWVLKHFYQYFFRIGYAFLPIAFAYSVMYLRHGKTKDLLLAGLSFVFLVTTPHFFVYYWMLIGLYSVYASISSGENSKIVLLRTILLGITLTLLVSFWLIPFLSSTSSGSAGYRPNYIIGKSQIQLYSERNNMLNEFTLLGGYTRGILEEKLKRGEWQFLPQELYQAIFILIPILAFIGLLAKNNSCPKKKSKDYLFLVGASLLILAISTGYRTPFGSFIYDFVLIRIPYHEVFRAPDRFSVLFALLTVYLMATSFNFITSKKNKALFLIALLMLTFSLTIPATRIFNSNLAPAQTPEDFREIETRNLSGIFVFPPRPLSGYEPMWKTGREGGIIESYNVKFYAVPDSRSHIFDLYIAELINQNYTQEAIKILEKLGVKHILIRRDVKYPPRVPSPEELDSKLSKYLPKEYEGDYAILYKIPTNEPVVSVGIPFIIQSEDIDILRNFSLKSPYIPIFSHLSLAEDYSKNLNGATPFHPSSIFQKLNQEDILSRPVTYSGVIMTGINNYTLTIHNESLFLSILAFSTKSRVEIVTSSSNHIVYNNTLNAGLNEICVGPLNSSLTIYFYGYINVRHFGTTTQNCTQTPIPPLDTNPPTIPRIIYFHRKSPTSWEIQVDSSTSPFILVINEVYDPLWKAKVYKNGKLIETRHSIPAYGVVNGFIINTTGNLEIEVSYAPDFMFKIGSVVSILTLLCLVATVIISNQKSKKKKQKS